VDLSCLDVTGTLPQARVNGHNHQYDEKAKPCNWTVPRRIRARNSSIKRSQACCAALASACSYHSTTFEVPATIIYLFQAGATSAGTDITGFGSSSCSTIELT
jgi:hypothetical protein